MKMTRIFFSLALIAALLAIGIGCGGEVTVTATKTAVATETVVPTEGPQSGGTLRIIWSTGPGGGWGWCVAIFGGEGAYGDMAMEGLFEGTFLGGIQVPRLATDYSYSADGKVITFNLRQGVTFHDGTPFNADAVKYNHDAMMEAGRVTSNLLSCDVIDDYTVKFTFEEELNTNFYAVSGLPIASPTYVEEVGPDVAAHNAVGTGPFKQVSYDPDTKIRLERYDDYWGQKAYLDAIEGTWALDPVTLVMAMQAGQGDCTHSRDARTMADLRQAGFNINETLMGMEAMYYNSRDEDSPFHDVRVREAFEYAINKEKLVKALGYGYWEEAYQFQLPGMSGYLDDIVKREYDPDKARELLELAGYGGGFHTTIVHGEWDFNDGVQAIQADLAEVGITCDLLPVQFGTWATTRQDGWDGIFIAGSGMTSNFNSTLAIYFGSPDLTEMYSIMRPQELLDAVQVALHAIPQDDELSKECHRIIYEYALWGAIEHHGDNMAYTDRVHGLNQGYYGQWGAFDAELVWMSD